jgi:hypothetical protein
MDYDINNVIETIDREHKDFALEIHTLFVNKNYKCNIDSKSAGYLVVYKDPRTKKSAFNFYFRKNGLHVRLYFAFKSGNVTPTDYMVSEIDKQPDCKRLTNTGECSDRCPMGFDFELRGKRYQKCRMSAFSFLVTEESKPVIEKWVREGILAGEEKK